MYVPLASHAALPEANVVVARDLRSDDSPNEAFLYY